MSKSYARIDDGVVLEIVELPDDVEIEKAFHPSLTFVPAEGGAGIGWHYDAKKKKLVPPPPKVYSKAELAAYTANRRWHAENGGITVGGMAVETDDRSKMMIMGARIQATADPQFKTNWKTPYGFAAFDAAAMIAISDAVLAHVDACFAIEASVLAAIEAGEIETIAAIDEAGWPSAVHPS